MDYIKSNGVRIGLIILFLITAFFTYQVASREFVGKQDILIHIFFYTSIATSIACVAYPFFSFRTLKLNVFKIKFGAFVVGVAGAGLIGIDHLFNLGYAYNYLKEFSDKGGLWILNISLLIGAQILIDVDQEVEEKIYQDYEEKIKEYEKTIELNKMEMDRLRKVIELLKS